MKETLPMCNNRKIYIELLDSGVTYQCRDKEDVEVAIREEYNRSDVVMGEVLANIAIHGLSTEDVVTIYTGLLNQFERDMFVQFYGDHTSDEVEDMIQNEYEVGNAYLWNK